jgi:hemerythrin-like domain-containing protein
MMPIAPLMIEHRLIEKMAALLGSELAKINAGTSPDKSFLLDAVDFFKAYADRLHHGKEEKILFSKLGSKKLPAEHMHLLTELLNEHTIARKNIAILYDATCRHSKGDLSALEGIKSTLQLLSVLYPAHIEKEDMHFFIPVMGYFSQDEKDAMLTAFKAIDADFPIGKYNKLVEKYLQRA